MLYWSIINSSYAFVQGPLYFGMDVKPRAPGISFPLFRSILGLPEAQSYGILIIGDWISFKFSTFVVSLYVSLGLAGLIASIVFVYIVSNMSFLRVKSQIYFSQFVIYLLYFQIIGQDVFYFKHYTRGGDLFILTCFAFAFLFRGLQQSGAPVILERIDKKTS